MFHQHQQMDHRQKEKRAFDLFYLAVAAFQRGATVPIRGRYGSEALGAPGLAACLLILGWAVVSRSPFMWGWFAIWMVSLMARRAETAKLLRQGERIHSRYDGDPKLAMKFTKSDKAARMFVEPLLLIISAGIVGVIEADSKMPTPGLGVFLMIGAFSVLIVEGIYQQVLRKRSQSLLDAQMEHEDVMEDFQNRWGDS
jgi:hypothetical protein